MARRVAAKQGSGHVVDALPRVRVPFAKKRWTARHVDAGVFSATIPFAPFWPSSAMNASRSLWSTRTCCATESSLTRPSGRGPEGSHTRCLRMPTASGWDGDRDPPVLRPPDCPGRPGNWERSAPGPHGPRSRPVSRSGGRSGGRAHGFGVGCPVPTWARSAIATTSAPVIAGPAPP